MPLPFRFARLLVIPFVLFTCLVFAKDNPVRIMSYNIRLPHTGDGIHYWDQRRPLLTSLIRFHEPDVIGLQEAFRRQLDEISADLPQYEWYGVCRTDGSTSPSPDNEFSAILFRKDRFERLDGGTFWLSATPDIPGSVGWDAALPRIVTWVLLLDKSNGNQFYHFNTHFDHMGRQARAESAKLLLQHSAQIAGNKPTSFTGDYNCTADDDPYIILTDATQAHFLRDAMYASVTPHYGTLTSFSPTFL